MVQITKFLYEFSRNSIAIFKEYCAISSLAGVGYMVNEKLHTLSYFLFEYNSICIFYRYHLSEKIFWLICLTLSAFGSYYLIEDYRSSFEGNAISMVVETIRPQETTNFPSIGVCELGFPRKEYHELEEIVERLDLSFHHPLIISNHYFNSSLRDNPSIQYNYDIEDFLLRIVFQNIYSFGSLAPYCSPYYNCNDCTRCPNGNYSHYAERVGIVTSQIKYYKGSHFDFSY